MSAKEISAPVDIGNQGSGNVNIGSVLNNVFFPGLTASKVLQLDGSNKVFSADVSISDLTPSGVGTIYSDGTSILTSNGVAGQVWTSNAPLPPSWQAVGGAGVSTFSAGTTGFTPNAPTAGAIVLGGTLGIANGGTNATTIGSLGSVAYSTGTAYSFTVVGTSGQLLTSAGAGAPTWTSLSSIGVTSFSAGTTGLTPNAPTAGAIVLGGTLGIANGGTNSTATPTAGGVSYGTGTAYAFTAAGTSGQLLTSAGAGVPTWTDLSSIGVTSFSAGTTGLTPNAPTAGAIVLSGTLIAVNGGTGISSYAIGDLLYADTTTTLARLADVAVGSVLLSGGLNTAPGWGQVNLTSMVTGVLPIANGGTNASTIGAAGTVAFSSGTAYSFTAAGTSGQLLTSAGVGTPTWTSLSSIGVTSFSAGTTGLTPNAPTAGAIVLGGTLAIANGGTNSTATPTAGGVSFGTGTAYAFTAAGTSGQLLTSAGAGTPTWTSLSSIGVTSFSAGTTGLTPNAPTAGAIVLSGTLIAVNGGTGQSSYAVGDLLYANTTTTLARLADVAVGSVLLSGGLNTAPGWGQVDLASMVIGVLPLANGGTNANLTAVNGGTVYSTGSALAISAAGTAGQVWTSNGAAAPTWQAAGGGGITTIGANTTTTADSAIISGGNTLQLAQAGATNRGIVYGTFISGSMLSYGLNAASSFTGAAVCNTIIGEGSASSMTGTNNDSYNTIVGYNNANLASGANFSSNLMVGNNIYSTATTGIGNSNYLIGDHTLSSINVATNNNILIGRYIYNAATALTVGGLGQYDIMIGNGIAHLSASVGGENVIIGAESCISLTGYENTIIGTLSGQSLTSGTNNIMLGYFIDQGGALTTGSFNIYIGGAVQPSGAAVTGEVVIGYRGGVGATGNGNNTFTIGTDHIQPGAGGGTLTYNTTTGQVTFNASSLRYKNPLPDIDMTPFLGYLDQLQPRCYTMKNDSSNTQHIGYFAEEVEAIVGPNGNPVFENLLAYTMIDDTSKPQIQVSKTIMKNGVPTPITQMVYQQKKVVDTVLYHGLTVPLIARTKQMNQLINTMQTTITAMQAQIATLQSQVTALQTPPA